MMNPNNPIEHCYWVVPGQFLAGEYPRNLDEESSRSKIDALIRAGVTAFIDLTEERELLYSYRGLVNGILYKRFPIRDQSIPHSKEHTEAILDEIDRAIRLKGIAYVHCLGGIGRTGVIVGCWLARHGFQGEAALNRLHEMWKGCPKSARRPKSPENRTQERYIVQWKEVYRPVVHWDLSKDSQ